MIFNYTLDNVLSHVDWFNQSNIHMYIIYIVNERAEWCEQCSCPRTSHHSIALNFGSVVVVAVRCWNNHNKKKMTSEAANNSAIECADITV